MTTKPEGMAWEADLACLVKGAAAGDRHAWERLAGQYRRLIREIGDGPRREGPAPEMTSAGLPGSGDGLPAGEALRGRYLLAVLMGPHEAARADRPAQ